MVWVSLAVFVAVAVVLVAIGRWALRRAEEQDEVLGARGSRANRDPGFLAHLGNYIRGGGPR